VLGSVASMSSSAATSQLGVGALYSRSAPGIGSEVRRHGACDYYALELPSLREAAAAGLVGIDTAWTRFEGGRTALACRPPARGMLPRHGMRLRQVGQMLIAVAGHIGAGCVIWHHSIQLDPLCSYRAPFSTPALVGFTWGREGSKKKGCPAVLIPSKTPFLLVFPVVQRKTGRS